MYLNHRRCCIVFFHNDLICATAVPISPSAMVTRLFEEHPIQGCGRPPLRSSLPFAARRDFPPNVLVIRDAPEVCGKVRRSGVPSAAVCSESEPSKKITPPSCFDTSKVCRPLNRESSDTSTCEKQLCFSNLREAWLRA
jgi:hypothetical protein